MEYPDEFLCAEEEIHGYLSKLDTTKANGPDGLCAKMLKETATSITPAVTKLFNTSLQLGKLPADWKHALITPITRACIMQKYWMSISM